MQRSDITMKGGGQNHVGSQLSHCDNSGTFQNICKTVCIIRISESISKF
jgi:hypothetical protein